MHKAFVSLLSAFDFIADAPLIELSSLSLHRKSGYVHRHSAFGICCSEVIKWGTGSTTNRLGRENTRKNG